MNLHTRSNLEIESSTQVDRSAARAAYRTCRETKVASCHTGRGVGEYRSVGQVKGLRAGYKLHAFPDMKAA